MEVTNMRAGLLRAGLLLVVAGLMLGAGVVQAQWTALSKPMSWDWDQDRWENGNEVMWLNTDPQPFYYGFFGTGADEFDETAYPDACQAVNPGDPTSTKWAGQAVIGLYHTDTGGEPGFQQTVPGRWLLVSCSALDPAGGTPKKYPASGDILFTCNDPDTTPTSIDRCDIMVRDEVQTAPCSGNCQNEIVTTIAINLDNDCDGNADPGFESDVCLYWEAEKPPVDGPYWVGNLQVRINSGGGDKTNNFGELLGPTSVTLADLSAEPNSRGLIALALTGVIAMAAVLAWMAFRRLAR